MEEIYELLETGILIDGENQIDYVTLLIKNKEVELAPNFLKILEKCTGQKSADIYLNRYSVNALYKNQSQIEEEIKDLRQKILMTNADLLAKIVYYFLKRFETKCLLIGCESENGYMVKMYRTDNGKIGVTAIKDIELQDCYGAQMLTIGD